MIYNYVKHNDSETIALIFVENGRSPVSISPEHPKWDEVNSMIPDGSLDRADESSIMDIISKDSAASSVWLTKLSDRVSASIYGVVLDGQRVDSKLTKGITSALGDNPEDLRHIRALARFLEKAETNPSLPGADELYDWILSEGLTLTSDGDFVGYKAVEPISDQLPTNPVDLEGNPVSEEDLLLPEERWVSSRSGGGIVNGVEYLGHVPNFVGAVVEMPRDKVDADGRTECSVGLHVGTFAYARWFAGTRSEMLLVKVNPRDVVSVPKYDFKKLRACKYTVIASGIKNKLDEHLYVDVVHAPIVEETEEEAVVDTIAVVESIIAKIRASRV